jgi:HEAT repeat protein
MDDQTQRRAVLWLDGLPLTAARRIEALDPAQAGQSPTVRLLALRRLIGLGEPDAQHTIAAFCFDADSLIARIALRYLVHHRYEQLPALLARLSSSPHPRVRRLAEAHLAPTGFARLWAAWPRLDRRTRITAGRALIKIDPKLNHKLAQCLHAPSPDDRLQALSMIRLLKLETFFEQELFALNDDADPRVVSSVVAAMPALGDSPQVRRRVIMALKHDDDRVCSNAIEAIEALGIEAAAAPVLQRFAERGENRSRATAIKALMQLPMSQAIGELARMLDDDQPTHRVSALWVVRQLELLGLVHKVAALAKADPQPDVRKRALGTIRRMIRDRRRDQSTARGPQAQADSPPAGDETEEAVA